MSSAARRDNDNQPPSSATLKEARRGRDDVNASLVDLTNIIDSPLPRARRKRKFNVAQSNVFNINGGHDDVSASDDDVEYVPPSQASQVLNTAQQPKKKKQKIERTKEEYEEKVKSKKAVHMRTLGRLLSGEMDNKKMYGYQHDQSLLAQLQASFAVEVGSVNLPNKHQLHGKLLDAAEFHRLMIAHFAGRDVESSGYNGPMTEEILVKICPELKPVFDDVRKKFKINHVFAVRYGKNGHHHWHQDKHYKGNYRMVISLFSWDKYMLFKRDGRMCCMKLQHGSVVILDNVGVRRWMRLVHWSGV